MKNDEKRQQKQFKHSCSLRFKSRDLGIRERSSLNVNGFKYLCLVHLKLFKQLNISFESTHFLAQSKVTFYKKNGSFEDPQQKEVH